MRGAAGSAAKAGDPERSGNILAKKNRRSPLQSSPAASSRPEGLGVTVSELEGALAGMGHSVEMNRRFRKSEGKIHLIRVR